MGINGIVDADKVINFSVATMNDSIEAYVLDSTPTVMSIGKRCMTMGYHFVWKPYKKPYILTPKGKKILLEVIDNVPYLPLSKAIPCAPAASVASEAVIKNQDDLDEHEYSGVRLIAHNAGYDFNFIMRYIHRVRCIYRGSHLISASGIFTSFRSTGKITFSIEVKDSYNMISSPLRDFHSMFGMEFLKEVMPYDLYNVSGNISKRFVDIEYALTFVKKSDHVQFLDNIKKWGLEKDGKYDIIEYS